MYYLPLNLFAFILYCCELVFRNANEYWQQHVFLQPAWTGNIQPASRNSVTSAVPPSPQIVDPGECDWSEHSCPDGYKYYYNCITCESRVSYLPLLTRMRLLS
jgi:CUG-BP- and ETR3-like factor